MNQSTLAPLTDFPSMLPSVLSNSSLFVSDEEQPDVSNESLPDCQLMLPSVPTTCSLQVSHKEQLDVSNEVDVSLASQMAVRNILLHFNCDSWQVRIPFCVSLPQFSPLLRS
jgi:hypothetical protein